MVQNDQSSTRNNQKSESAAAIAAAAAVKLMNNGKPQPNSLQHQNSDASSKRVTRKGSSASRTSRSRTSPRVSNRDRAGVSSSDEGMFDLISSLLT